jgi:TetR/AcrR family transcriptional repressor of nem operon
MSSKQKIVDKAAELIHTRGFNHTSIQDILDAASVTKSNFYYHFESKEQLAFEVLGERMRQFYAVAIGPSI